MRPWVIGRRGDGHLQSKCKVISLRYKLNKAAIVSKYLVHNHTKSDLGNDVPGAMVSGVMDLTRYIWSLTAITTFKLGLKNFKTEWVRSITLRSTSALDRPDSKKYHYTSSTTHLKYAA